MQNTVIQTSPPSILERAQGSLVGLACGDAIGTSVEFSPRGSFPTVTDMYGGGVFNLKPGEWTDDTSMALCLAESLIHSKGFNPTDQMNRYCNWYQYGYLSSNGTCFDIGNTVRSALEKYLKTSDPYSGSTHPNSAGNGSIMRLAPVAIYYYKNINELIHFAAESSRTTHGSLECLESCQLLATQLSLALTGADKDSIIAASRLNPFQSEKVQSIHQGDWKQLNYEQLIGSGYVIESLQASLWCFYYSESFSDAVLKATNLGDDADTTAAITGQLAGAYYGINNIPENWQQKIVMNEEIKTMAMSLLKDENKHASIT